MHISEHFGLGKTQYELDFVDAEIDGDLPLFMDPHLLAFGRDEWSIEATELIGSFFQELLTALRAGDVARAWHLFAELREPKETGLGFSQGARKGKGAGPKDAERVFNELRKSKAIKTGLVQDIQDSQIFVKRVGPDKVSDMASNILRRKLADYTIEQCELWGIPRHEGVPLGPMWSGEDHEWVHSFEKIPVVNGVPILLVPKWAVSVKFGFDHRKFHNFHVLPYLQNEHTTLESAFARIKHTKNGIEVKKPYKKTLVKGLPAPDDKEFLADFASKHPEIYAKFKGTLQNTPFSDTFTKGESMSSLIDHLKSSLVAIPTGNDYAADYHNLMLGILELLFYPTLVDPSKEEPINNGRKRIDIVFLNTATKGIFNILSTLHKIRFRVLVIECKNYETDPVNPEVDQIAGRFSNHTTRFGLLIARKALNRPKLIQRCADVRRQGNGFVLPLLDSDILEMLEARKLGNEEVEKILKVRYQEILMT